MKLQGSFGNIKLKLIGQWWNFSLGLLQSYLFEKSIKSLKDYKIFFSCQGDLEYTYKDSVIYM